MSHLKTILAIGVALTALGLSGCGGGGGDGDDPPLQPPATTYTVGGNVSGLTGNVVLRLNGANDLTVSAAGAFTFANRLANGAAYAVTVQTQPATQTCAVTSGAGNVAAANVANVAITCANIPVLSGVAAVGTPLVGTVTVKDAAGATKSVVIGLNGAYSVNVAGMTPPFVLRAEGTANGNTYVIHSAAVAADLGGNINITQLTDLAVANIAGQIASAYFNAGNFSALTKTALDAEITQLRTRLLPVLQALGVDASIDLLRAQFTPAQSALDTALDMLRVSFDTTNNIATIRNVVTQQQIQDNLAVPAATEAGAPVMSTVDNLASAASDRDAVVAAVTGFGARFATAPLPSTLAAGMSTTLLQDDLNRGELAAYLANETTLVQSTWTDVAIHNVFYGDPAGATAVVDFTIKDKDGREMDRVTGFGVRRDPDNTWRLSGNQRVVSVSADVHVYRGLSNGGCISTGIEFEIEDNNSANNGGTINHFQIIGPGLPAGGLRFELDGEGDWGFPGTGGSRYEFANNCGYTGLTDTAIAAIPDNAAYLFVPYSSADNSVRINFPSGALVLPGNPFNGTYLDLVAKRAPTVAEAVASNSFPTISVPTSAASLANYSGGPRNISAGNLNPASRAGVILQYRTRLGNHADVDADLAPADDGTLSTTLSLPELPAGDAITYRSVRVDTKDASRRTFMTGYEDRYYTISGTVTGLSGSVTLRLNNSVNVVVNASGQFSFPASLADGTAYGIVVNAVPATQACLITAGGFGTINLADVTNVAVTCTNYTIGGTITGLTSPGLMLQVSGGNDLAVPVGSTFTFPPSTSVGPVPFYSVHIKTQPAGQTCTVVRSTGNLVVAPNVSTVGINCIDNVTDPLSGTYLVTSYAGQPVAVAGFLSFNPDGTYIFALHQDTPGCLGNNGNGIEYGVYNWNQATHDFALLNSVIDNNGECGLGNDGVLSHGTLVKNSDGTLTADWLDTNESGDRFIFEFAPVASAAGTLTGSWGDNQSFVVFRSDNTFMHATTKAIVNSVITAPGIEHGCYTLLSGGLDAGSFSTNLSGTCALNGTQLAVDTTGPNAGFSVFTTPVFFSVAGDVMTSFAGPVTPLVFSASRIKPN